MFREGVIGREEEMVCRLVGEGEREILLLSPFELSLEQSSAVHSQRPLYVREHLYVHYSEAPSGHLKKQMSQIPCL